MTMHTSVRSLAPVFALLLSACNGGSGDTTTATTTTDATADTPADTTADVPTGTEDPPTTGDGGPKCGNGELDVGEDCDGSELGGKTCADVGGADPDGALACAANCKFDDSDCGTTPGTGTVALNELTSLGSDVGPYAGLGDAIELYNPGDAAIDLSGWKLSDDETFPADKTYVFPAGTTLEPAAYRVLVALDADTMEGEFPFGLSSTKDEVVTLADADGATVDSIVFSGADATTSYCRLPDGTGAWQRCDSTLGGANIAASQTCGDGEVEAPELCDGDDLGGATCESLGYTGGTLGCGIACSYDQGECVSDNDIVVNELESTDDQIEIFNSGAMPVDISGWILTDDPAGPDYDPTMDPEKLVFPANSMLAGDTFLTVAKGDLPGQHPFGLGAGGDTVTLLKADFTLVDQVTYGAQQAAVSYCRLPDGPGSPWQADCVPTFGAANEAP